MCNDENMKSQMQLQLNNIFGNIKFSGLNNALRYPKYQNNKKYFVTFFYKNDCNEIQKMLGMLKVYLNDLDKI